jgi:hypothetical protein
MDFFPPHLGEGSGVRVQSLDRSNCFDQLFVFRLDNIGLRLGFGHTLTPTLSQREREMAR